MVLVKQNDFKTSPPSLGARGVGGSMDGPLACIIVSYLTSFAEILIDCSELPVVKHYGKDE